MEKKHVGLIAGIIGVVAVAAGVMGFLFAKKVEAPVGQSNGFIEENPVVENITSMSQQERLVPKTAKTGYKIVEVKNPDVLFSFEIPEKWMTETRNSGEKQLSVEEMRDFLGTQYTYTDPDSGKIQSYPAYSDGVGTHTTQDIKAATAKEIQQSFTMYHYPNVSVSAVDYIWYGEFNASQIDFRVEDGLTGDIVNNVKTGEKEQCKNEPIDSNLYGCGNSAPRWEKSMIAGKNVYVETFATDRDEKGNELIGKGSSGGKTYYIETPNLSKTLIIKKQARGDAQFEKDFENLIQTLEIQSMPSEVATRISPHAIVGWQTYLDEKYGFSFRYPGNWTESGGIVPGGDAAHFSSQPYEIPASGGDMNVVSGNMKLPDGMVIHVAAWSNPKGLSVEDFVSGKNGLNHQNKDKDGGRYNPFKKLRTYVDDPRFIEELSGYEEICGKDGGDGNTGGYYIKVNDVIVRFGGRFFEGNDKTLDASECSRDKEILRRILLSLEIS